MIRIHLPYLYAFAEALEGLDQVKEGLALKDVIYSLWNAKQKIDELINQSVFAHALISSRNSGEALITAIDAQMQQNNADINRILEPFDAWGIASARQQFRIALLAEMGVFPSFFVNQKDFFDTLTLLDRPQRLFPDDLVQKVPEAQFDVAEAARCFAFELATASAFHIFRVVESVLRRYYAHVTQGKAHPKVRTIGVYVKAIRRSVGGDEKILSSLEQLSSLHRNPLIHPEAALSHNESIAIFGMARSVITAMLDALPPLPQTTSTAIQSAP